MSMCARTATVRRRRSAPAAGSSRQLKGGSAPRRTRCRSWAAVGSPGSARPDASRLSCRCRRRRHRAAVAAVATAAAVTAAQRFREAMDRATGDLQLIRLVRQHPFLYDTNSDSYKNIKLKESIWKKISSAVGLPVDTSKTRWKSLRTSYLRHCKMIACRKKESTKCRKWPLADELTFLNPYLVPADYVPGTPGREEPEPLSEDAMARVYGDPTGRLATSPPVEAIVGIEEEYDDIEEIIEHHPQDEEMADAFKRESTADAPSAPGAPSTPAPAASAAAANGAPSNVADSVSSEELYSPVSASVEADPPAGRESRPDPRPNPRSAEHRVERAARRFGSNGALSNGALSNGLAAKREAGKRPASYEDSDALNSRDTTRDFFLYLAETVKTFPPYLQAQVKGKCFEAVNSAELSMVSRASYASNHSKFGYSA